MVKHIGDTDTFAFGWSRKNRRIASLHFAEAKKAKVIPIIESLKKKKL